MARLSYPFKYGSSSACRNNDAVLKRKKYIDILDSFFAEQSGKPISLANGGRISGIV